MERLYLSLEERKKCSLELLKCFDAFCSSHSIRYSLSGGTLLGAIRHNGFIPWDDDIDVELPRPDYLRFVKEYHDPTGQHKCFAPEIGNSMITYARLCEMKETVSVPYCPWCKEDTGIYIDIFPIDALPDDQHEYEELVRKLEHQVSILYQCRGATLTISKDLGVIRVLKALGKKILYGGKDIDKIVNSVVQELLSRDYRNANYAGQIAYPMYWRGKFLEKDIFESYIKVSFEGAEFWAISDYDRMLTALYRDYMTLPPEEDRVPAHSEHMFFWRRKGL